MDRAGVAGPELALGLEVGAARAIPALVGALADPAVVVNPLDDLGHLRLVARVRGADEEVVAGADDRPQRLELGRVAIGQLLRRDPLPLRRRLDRLPMLIGPGEEEDVLPPLAHVPRQHVGSHRRVGVPEMRLRVDVVDRGGDEVAHETTTAFCRPPRIVSGHFFCQSQAIYAARGPSALGRDRSRGCR